MMVDIDYFKQYNDTYGHLEGDEALVKVATTLKKTFCRAGDFVFRLGGEEFGILLADSSKDNSIMLASKLLRNISDLEIEHKNSSVDKNLSISIGICSIIPLINDEENYLIKCADEALYRAKESGRNRYSVN